MGLANWSQSLAVTAKYCCSLFLRKNASLGEFHNLLVIGWVCCRLAAVKGITYGEDYGLGFCVGTCSEVCQGKPRPTVALDQTSLSVSAVLNVLIVCWKVATNWSTLWNQKLWCGTLFLHKKSWNEEFFRPPV